MIKVIIFDLAGVCFIDFGVGNKKNSEKYAKMLGISTENLHEIWHSPWQLLKKGKISESEFWKVFIEKSNSKITVEDLKRAVRNEMKPIQGIMNIINKLRKNYKLVMLTNNSKEWVNYIIENFKIDQKFDVIINSADVNMAKPETSIYKFTLEKIKIPPQECIFIDDTEKNLITARELGMKTILFKSVEQLKNDLTKLGVRCDG
jgi:putative hydrolase of the HAD superfamily